VKIHRRLMWHSDILALIFRHSLLLEREVSIHTHARIIIPVFLPSLYQLFDFGIRYAPYERKQNPNKIQCVSHAQEQQKMAGKCRTLELAGIPRLPWRMHMQFKGVDC
jgi:hypothetical protein